MKNMETIFFKDLGAYRYLVIFFFTGLVLVWGECGMPRFSYLGGFGSSKCLLGQWMLCFMDAPAHEIFLRLVGL